MSIENLTIAEARTVAAMFAGDTMVLTGSVKPGSHPMLGRRCVVRTYSAGVHIGTVASVDGMECHLTDALRLWQWTGGGLSLSVVATNGIKGGRLNRTPEVYLTNVIELIPTTPAAEATYVKFLED